MKPYYQDKWIKSANQSLIFSDSNWHSLAPLFENYHYLKRIPAGILACYALYDKDRILAPVGGAVFCNGRIQYDGKFLEFSRLWVSDDYPTNIESWFVGKCLKDLQYKFPDFLGVVTWADLGRGHNGIVYLACNFVFDGKSRPVKRYKSGNRLIYQRTVLNPSQFQETDTDIPKNRFIYYFDKKVREAKRCSQEVMELG